MTFDYSQASHAVRAHQALAAAGLAAAYSTHLVAPPEGGDTSATHLVVHRVEVAERDARRARSLLCEHGLLKRT